MEEKLFFDQGKLDLIDAETTFMEENPDADWTGFVQFANMQLNREEAEDADKKSETKLDFIKNIYDKFNKKNGSTSTDENHKSLPTDLSGVAGASGNVDDSDGGSDEDDSYARKSGLYR